MTVEEANRRAAADVFDAAKKNVEQLAKGAGLSEEVVQKISKEIANEIADGGLDPGFRVEVGKLSDEGKANRVAPPVKRTVPRDTLTEVAAAELEERYPLGTPIAAEDGTEGEIVAVYGRNVWGDEETPRYIYAVQGASTKTLTYHTFDEPPDEFWEACKEASEEEEDDGSAGVQ